MGIFSDPEKYVDLLQCNKCKRVWVRPPSDTYDDYDRVKMEVFEKCPACKSENYIVIVEGILLQFISYVG